MRTILDASTSFGTACVIDAKGGGDKYVISSAVSFLKELEKTQLGRIASSGSKQWWMLQSSRANLAKGDNSRYHTAAAVVAQQSIIQE